MKVNSFILHSTVRTYVLCYLILNSAFQTKRPSVVIFLDQSIKDISRFYTYNAPSNFFSPLSADDTYVPKFISGAERHAQIPMVSQTLLVFVTLCNCETNDYDELVTVLKKNWLDIESKNTKSERQGKFVL